jgi:hypothetical protein
VIDADPLPFLEHFPATSARAALRYEQSLNGVIGNSVTNRDAIPADVGAHRFAMRIVPDLGGKRGLFGVAFTIAAASLSV